MKTKPYSLQILAICIVAVTSCSSPQEKKSSDESEKTETSSNTDVTPKKERPVSIENGKFFEKDGIQYLYGGENESDHFDVTNSSLKPEQFHYGIGREDFPALLQPEFTTIKNADATWHDTTRFLLAKDGSETKAYAVPDLINHEVVNDMLNGKPIMAAYCILADLGAIYSRQYGDQVLTFALSGYTYYDPKVWKGLDGFVLWDRETESLWWPLIGKSVSGDLKGVKLQEMDESKWLDTDWKTIKAKYPNAQIMVSGQDFERPKSWVSISNVESIKKEFMMK